MVLSTTNFDPSFRKNPWKGKFQVYMRTGVIVAYFWLFLGLALFAIQLTTSEDILDAATHSIALGFIGTFIVAHSPIIFPMTLKRNAVQDNVTFLPLVVITIATAMRIFGDLASGLIATWNIGFIPFRICIDNRYFCIRLKYKENYSTFWHNSFNCAESAELSTDFFT